MRNTNTPGVIVIFPAAKTCHGDRPWPRGSFMEVAKHGHVHLSTGTCIKNRHEDYCP